jgi:hypothetical protein
MPNYSAYPQGTDLSSAFSQMGVTIKPTAYTSIQWAQFALSAQQKWELYTRWRPFLAPSQTPPTSDTALTLGQGTFTLTTGTGLPLAPNYWVQLQETANPQVNWMTARVLSYNSESGSLVIKVWSFGGNGTYNDWQVWDAVVASPGQVQTVPPNRYERFLVLPRGMISFNSIMWNGAFYEPFVNAIPTMANSQYAPYDGQPFDQLTFRHCYPYGGLNSIVVTGIFGYCFAMPPDAWNAVLYDGMFEAHPFVSTQVSGGLVSAKLADATMDYVKSRGGLSGGPLSGEAITWGEIYNKVLVKYKKSMVR